jgi:hypothetical protein
MVGRVPWHPTIELANSNLGRLRHDCVRQLGLGCRIGLIGGPGRPSAAHGGDRLGREGLTSRPIAQGRWFPREHRPFALRARGGPGCRPARFVGFFGTEARSCSHARWRGESLRFRARRVPAERLRRRHFGGAGGGPDRVDGPSPRPPRFLPAADTGRFPGLPLVHDLRGRRGHTHTRAGCTSLGSVHDALQAPLQLGRALVAAAPSTPPYPQPDLPLRRPARPARAGSNRRAANSARGERICANLARAGWFDLSTP